MKKMMMAILLLMSAVASAQLQAPGLLMYATGRKLEAAEIQGYLIRIPRIQKTVNELITAMQDEDVKSKAAELAQHVGAPVYVSLNLLFTDQTVTVSIVSTSTPSDDRTVKVYYKIFTRPWDVVNGIPTVSVETLKNSFSEANLNYQRAKAAAENAEKSSHQFSSGPINPALIDNAG